MAKDTIISNEVLQCKEWIEDALEYCGGTHHFDDIVEGIYSGRMQLWQGPRGCIVTEIVIYPRKKVLNLFLAGGKLDQIVDMNKDITDWAVKNGCKAGTMSGRIGWKKVLEPLGWKQMYTTFQKEVD